MADERVIYNGVSMAADWPAKILAAQGITHYIIGGKSYPRIRYGDEADDWGANRMPAATAELSMGNFTSLHFVMWSAAPAAAVKFSPATASTLAMTRTCK